MAHRWKLTLLILTAPLVAGCGLYEAVRGESYPPPSRSTPAARPTPPSKTRPDGTRWVLIRNPRFGATMADPEYIWVEEDKVPKTLSSVIFGKQSVLASHDVVATYGPPPDGGQISPLQGGLPRRGLASVRPTSPRRSLGAEEPVIAEVTRQGYIVFIQNRLIAVDLTSADGLRIGSTLSLRRGSIPLTHPATGEYLGELNQEIGTARVIELRERFSVAEIQELRPGIELKVKDRAVVKPK
ncbi:MAG: hypothetical protein ACE5K9_11170 [Candidatus Methylomirabilales bacterium]